MNLIKWILNKKELEKEMDNLDRDLDLKKSEYARLKSKFETMENEMFDIQSRNNDYLEVIKEQRKEIRKIKRELKCIK
jgi:predicted  nucleic acid-binding Zn-ribbon protein